MVNLRRYGRLRVAVDVEYRIIGAKGVRKARTKSSNIGLEGICFKVADRYKAGTRVNLEIFLQKDDPAI